MSYLLRNSILTVLYFYRNFISMHLGPSCRFEPTCSSYAIEAFQRHNLFRAIGLTVVRLSKCRPGGGCGIDEVPKGDVAHPTKSKESNWRIAAPTHMPCCHQHLSSTTQRKWRNNG